MDGDKAEHLTEDELVFLAEEEPVTIIPLFSSAAVATSGGTLGPFKAQRQVEVPLWFALSLKRRRKCIVQPPAWLDAGSLADCLEEDRNTAPTATQQGGFAALPFRYYEVATLLLREASDDITEASRVRLLVEDLRAVRQNKLHNMLNITSRIVSDELPKEISHAEMNVVRPFMVKALGAFDRYDVAGGGAEGTQTQLGGAADDFGGGDQGGGGGMRSQPRELR